uniref:Cytochrome c oxidase subunit 2 n=1 Tax=Pseudanoplocephala crawfordi TaxID=1480107 RepID=A0A0U2PHF9_9CEST|nr:cytochrome c oxidase subunit II [Pseudanoplocephala crawfordi]ALJ78638.1 cytochrome c oxidase subunit 2 [Pseudanoplocephala crawfordi]
MNLYLLYYDIVCYIFAVCVFIICFVYMLLFWGLLGGGSVALESENQVIEFIWTVLPTIIVLVLCGLNVNFITNNLDTFCEDTIKIVGHQWYWSYEYNDGEFDSFSCLDGLLVDKPLRLVYGVPYHLIVTSADVIHSFHVPSLNLKMDAIPGRLNHLFFCPSLYGLFIGYCAELCGVNHSVMPIAIEVVNNVD